MSNLSRKDIAIIVAQGLISVAAVLGFFPALRFVLWCFGING